MEPLYQADCWYIPEGTWTVFSSTKGHVRLYPGWLIMYNAESKQEVFRVPLPADVKTQNWLGCAVISHADGKRISWTNRKYQYYFYNPMIILLSYLFAFFSMSKASALIGAIKQAAGKAQ